MTNQNLFIEQEPGSYSLPEAKPLEQITEALSVLLEQKFQFGNPLTSPSETKNLLLAKLALKEREFFCCLYLNNAHQVIKYEELFKGTVNGASVYPREVAKNALNYNAAAVIIAHNHPSGEVVPSEADKLITRRLTEALGLIDIRLLDHIIVGGSNTLSFAEKGLI